MRNFGGFGGGNMQAMMKQAQAMQQQIQKKKQEIEEKVFTSSSGGGMVTVKMLGNYKIAEIKIKPEAIDPDDAEMLEDLVAAAVNDACAQVLAERDGLAGGMI